MKTKSPVLDPNIAIRNLWIDLLVLLFLALVYFFVSEIFFERKEIVLSTSQSVFLTALGFFPYLRIAFCLKRDWKLAGLIFFCILLFVGQNIFIYEFISAEVMYQRIVAMFICLLTPGLVLQAILHVCRYKQGRQ